tara:strand:+ start:390 stop:542 length:153 start_codon:yes stop_codon:yes gene_type:complete
MIGLFHDPLISMKGIKPLRLSSDWAFSLNELSLLMQNENGKARFALRNRL